MRTKFFLLALVLLLSGCTISIKTSGGADGGVFKSYNNGEDWQQITQVYRVGDIEKTFKTVDLTDMLMDPTDNQALYIGTMEHGVYYTYDGGVGWHNVLTGLGTINDIVVSPKERCIIYVAIANRVYKSTDCSRHWQYQLIEAIGGSSITSLAVDPFNTNIVYAGTSGRSLFRSYDAGFSWQTVKFFKGRITKLMINPNNNKIMYVVTAGDGIQKSTDGGESWFQLLTDEVTKDRNGINDYRNLIFDPTVDDGLLYASQYGLLRSRDGGLTWQEIDLLTPPGAVTIYGLAINPQNGQEIYYGISNTIYRTVDGGQNWITMDLPTSRAPVFLLVDPANPDALYMGNKQIK